MTVQELLTEFSEKVYENQYDRLPYSVWSFLAKYADKQCTIAVVLQLTGEITRSIYVDREKIYTSSRTEDTWQTKRTFGNFIENKW